MIPAPYTTPKAPTRTVTKPRVVDPNAPDALIDRAPVPVPSGALTADPNAAPWDVTPKSPAAPAPAQPTATKSVTGAAAQPVAVPGANPVLTAIPDGDGGEIPIPPTPPAAPAAAPAATMPWEGAAPVLFDAARAPTTAVPAAAPGAETAMPWEGTMPILTDRPGLEDPAAPSGANAPWETPTPPPMTLGADGRLPSAPDPQTAPSTFTADRNLIAREITPGAQQFAPEADILPSQSARATRLQDLEDQQLARITQGPDRFALARDNYDAFTEQANSDTRRAVIDETNAAAEGGYLGSGRQQNAYGDVEERRRLQDLNARRTFLNDALAGTIEDNRANLGAVTGVSDRAYGRDATDRAETRDERDFRVSQQARNFDLGAEGRDEVRTERDYQRQLAEQAIYQRMAQQAAEAGLTQQEFENAMRQYQLGNLNNPEDALGAAADRTGLEAAGAGDDVADLLRAYMARRGTVPATAGV